MIFANSLNSNTLIVLPTGLGKTVIMIMLIAKVLNEGGGGKIVVIAPTRPLLEQHNKSFLETLDIQDQDCVIISGETMPEKRKDAWDKANIFICTPQTLRNDILSGYCNLQEIRMMIFDEAHRAVGDDPYVMPAKQYVNVNQKAHIIGFTASPGKRDNIDEIMSNLSIQNIEYMDESHPQVKPYIKSVKEIWEIIELPNELITIRNNLHNYIKSHLEVLKSLSLIDSIQISKFSRKKMLGIPNRLNKLRTEIGDTSYFGGMKSYGQIMLASHGLEVLETQGINTLMSYYNSKKQEFEASGKNSLRNFLYHPLIVEVIEDCEKLIHGDFIHPKLVKLKELLRKELEEEEDPRILVFANYKATVEYLVEELGKIHDVSVEKFVGQTSGRGSKGLSQKEQSQIMNSFRSGIYNTLVSTRVGEEGIDVAQCTLVVFYDMTPSGIRLIQRKGRTGRTKAGKVYYLIAKGTRDEGYFHASKAQRNKIKSDIDKVMETMQERKQSPENGLQSFFDNEEVINENEIKTLEGERQSNFPTIQIDTREKSSQLINELLTSPVKIIQNKLIVGDLQVSNRVGIERKTISDFCHSVIDRRLFEQLKQLNNYYAYPILILEGQYPGECNLSENAFRGALLSVVLDFNIHIIQTADAKETAKVISQLATKEQKEKNQSNVSKTPSIAKDTYDKQLSLLSAIPNIDRVIAIRLLEKFSSLEHVVNASIDELRLVKGLGPVKAKIMKEFLEASIEDTDVNIS